MNINYWNVPYEKLPSRGRFYPSGSRIRFRCLNVRDLKYLAAINEENSKEMIDTLLRSALLIEGMAFEKIKAMDRISLIFRIRANTFMLSNKYETEFDCPFCKSRVRTTFEMSQLYVRYVESSKITSEEISLGVVSGKYKDILDMRYSVGDPEIDDILNYTDVDALLAGKTGDEMRDEILNLPADEYSRLKKISRDAKCGVMGYVDIPCDKCFRPLRVGVDIRDVNFFNRLKISTMIRNQIQVSKYCGVVIGDEMPYNEVEMTIAIVNEMIEKEAESMTKKTGD